MYRCTAQAPFVTGDGAGEAAVEAPDNGRLGGAGLRTGALGFPPFRNMDKVLMGNFVRQVEQTGIGSQKTRVSNASTYV